MVGSLASIIADTAEPFASDSEREQNSTRYAPRLLRPGIEPSGLELRLDQLIDLPPPASHGYASDLLQAGVDNIVRVSGRRRGRSTIISVSAVLPRLGAIVRVFASEHGDCAPSPAEA